MSVADRVAAIDEFVRGCKSDGIWDSIKACCVICGWDTLGSALIPLKGAAPTSYNFVSGDYSRTSGLVGNGSTKYLDSNRANNADPLDSNHNALFITAASNSVSAYIGNGNGGPGLNQIIDDPVSGYTLTRNRTSSGDTSLPSGLTGFLGAARSSGTGFTLRSNGASSTITASSQAIESSTLAVLARRSGGAPQLYSAARISFYSIGESLDLALLDSRVSSLYTALRTSVAPQVSNAEAQDWVYRVYDNGGAVSQSTADAVSAFCDAIEGAGIRDRFYRLNLFAGSNLSAALVPLYRGPTYSGTTYGNPTDTNNGPFVASDYSESVGLQKTVAATKYLDTGLAPEDFTITTGHLSVYRGSGAASNNTMIGLRDAASTHYYEILKRGDSRHHAAWGGDSVVLPSTESAHEDAGLLTVTRTSSTLATLYRNSSIIGTQTASVTPGTTGRNWFVFALNTGSATTLWTATIPLMGYSIGAEMDGAQVSDYSASMIAFQAALGRET